VQDTVLRAMEWLAEAADHPRRCLEAWDTHPSVPYPLIIGKTFDLVTVHSRVGERVLDLYDSEHKPTGGAVHDFRVLKIGFLVRRDPDVERPLTVTLDCDAVYRTRSSGLYGYLLAPVPESEREGPTRWLRVPGVGGVFAFEFDELAAVLAHVAAEGIAFPVDDVPPPAPSYR